MQTRLRLGQFEAALEAAASYQEIFGKQNYFLELMDHGLDIERSVRADLMRIADRLDIPLLATNDSHYVHEDDADSHDDLLCVGVGRNKDDPNRFRFNGSGYYIKSSEEMRQLFSEIPEACNNTLAIEPKVAVAYAGTRLIGTAAALWATAPAWLVGCGNMAGAMVEGWRAAGRGRAVRRRRRRARRPR